MNIHVTVTCTHEYSCYPWRALMNIHVTRDGYSWIFMLPRDVYSWIFTLRVTGIINIHVTRDVYSWIFMLPVMNIHEGTSGVVWVIMTTLRVAWIIMSVRHGKHECTSREHEYFTSVRHWEHEYLWARHGSMNILWMHVTGTWIFMEYISRVTLEYSWVGLHITGNSVLFKLLMTCNKDYWSYPWRAICYLLRVSRHG